MAKRAPSTQPRTRRARTATSETPAQEADTAVAGTPDTIESANDDAADTSDAEFLAAETGPSEEEIRTRAYHRYLERGGNHGQDFDDWLEAERELKNGRRG